MAYNDGHATVGSLTLIGAWIGDRLESHIKMMNISNYLHANFIPLCMRDRHHFVDGQRLEKKCPI